VAETQKPPPLVLLAAQAARDICKRYQHKAKVNELLDDKQTAEEFFSLLVSKGLYPEAVQFWANALPKREAVWWACQCVREGHGDEVPARAAAALAAAEKWVTEPTETHRRATEAAARDAGGMNTAAGFAAQAAFWSGGSLAAPGQPVVAPDDTLTAVAVLGAVIHSALLMGALTFEENVGALLYVGFQVAMGTNRWREPVRTPSPARVK
jgi:hypothetical protein